MRVREKRDGDLGYMTTTVRDIDLRKTLDEALSPEVRPHTHINDASIVPIAAVGFAGECMAQAIGKLALVIKAQQGKIHLAGWDIQQTANSAGNAFSHIISRKDQPGAWHLGVEFEAVLSETGASRKEDIKAKRGPESIDAMIRRVLNPDPEDELFDTDPVNFRPAKAGDHVSVICGTALATSAKVGPKHSGPPPRIPRDDCMELTEFKKDLFRTGWWPGLTMMMRPTRQAQSENDKNKWKTGCGARDPHCFLSVEIMLVIGEIVKEAGFFKMVAQDASKMMDRKLWSPTHSRNVLLEEVGIAAVRDSHGFIDSIVYDVISECAAKVTARVLDSHLREISQVFERLVALGYTTEVNEYACNDMSDITHVENDAEGYHLFLQKEEGRFRFDYDPSSGDMYGWRLAAQDRLVGAFSTQFDPDADLQAGRAQAKWLELSAGEPGHVAYTQKDVGDINQLITSMSSIYCCLEKDHPKLDDGPQRP